MKEIEITLKVNDSLENCKNILEKQGFKIIRKSLVVDIYMTQKKLVLDNIDEILKSCILIRYLNTNGKEFKKITYKNKVYDGTNVVSEKKINVDCENLDKAYELFEAIGFEELVRVKYTVTVFSDGNKEFAFQEVENLGLLLEYESVKNMEDSTNEEIMNEKKNMIEEIKNAGINIVNEMDVKKAYELIEKDMLQSHNLTF